MSTFTIDFFELSFLAEACIPPRPIARAMFWQSLTDKYWHQMTEIERINLFEWLQRNAFYEESLQTEEDTQVFHARFNPDNQYIVKTKYDDKEEVHRTFKMGERYYTNRNSWIAEEYIISVEKFVPKKNTSMENSTNDKQEFKVGDKIKCIYGIGIITRLSEDKMHSVKIIERTNVGYPVTNLGVYEGEMIKI